MIDIKTHEYLYAIDLQGLQLLSDDHISSSTNVILEKTLRIYEYLHSLAMRTYEYFHRINIANKSAPLSDNHRFLRLQLNQILDLYIQIFTRAQKNTHIR